MVQIKIIRRIALLWLIITCVANVSALKAPDEYPDGVCELVAKDYQKQFGGSLVWIQPLQSNGAFEGIGEISSGHIINKAYSKERGVYFIDYKAQMYFSNVSEIQSWYFDITTKDSKVYDLSRGRPPFATHWKY